MKSSGYRAVFVLEHFRGARSHEDHEARTDRAYRLIDERDCLYYIDELKSQGYGGPVLVVSVVDDEVALGGGRHKVRGEASRTLHLAERVRNSSRGSHPKPCFWWMMTRSRAICWAASCEVGISRSRGARRTRGHDLIERETPDAVVLDIVMPDMNGFEVLRADQESAHLPAVAPGDHSFLAGIYPARSEQALSDCRRAHLSQASVQARGGFQRPGRGAANRRHAAVSSGKDTILVVDDRPANRYAIVHA